MVEVAGGKATTQPRRAGIRMPLLLAMFVVLVFAIALISLRNLAHLSVNFE